MKHLFFIGTFLFVMAATICSYGQIGIFSTPIESVSQEKNNDFFTIETWHSFDLYLGDKEYQLTYTSGGEDVFEMVALSFGTYKKKGKGFVLKDVLNGYKMSVEYINDSCLIFIGGPSCMEGKTLTWKYWDEELWDRDVFLIFNYKDIQKERHKYCRQKALNDSLVGSYGYNAFDGIDFAPLILREDGSYEYRYCLGNFLISKGKWSRKGNLLLLQDEYMDMPFYGLIQDDAIISRFFIGDTKGEKLYKQK